MTEVKNATVETTTDQIVASTDKTNPDGSVVETTQKTQPAEVEEEVISKKELEDLRKKAADYEGMIQKKRLEKLAKKQDQKPIENQYLESDPELLLEAAREEGRKAAEETFRKMNQQGYESNLQIAYSTWVKNNPWADDDSIVSEISKHFDPGANHDINSIISQLDRAALLAYPDKYKKFIEDKTKAEVLAQGNVLAVGAAGSGSGQTTQKSDTVITDKDKDMANRFFGGDINRYLKYKAKDN